MRRDEELDSFKRNINLTQYAASQGYELDRSRSGRFTAVMRSSSDKVVIILAHDGHWTYFSLDDKKDCGTIIDFVERRKNLSLGHIRIELRPWLDGTAYVPAGRGGDYLPSLEPMARDTGEARARLAAMHSITDFAYLSLNRAVPADFAMSTRFAGRIYEDHRSNVIFPHYNREGICGYEIKNRGFTGFSSGGIKGLWCSRSTEDDDTIVIGEAALDVLSYAYLHGDPKTRYFSTGGSVNDAQLDLIKAAVQKMPTIGPQVVLAMDNDEAGIALAEKIQSFLASELPDKCFVEVKVPQGSGDDWNDVLRRPEAENHSIARSPEP